jgi:hypothetical protein
MLFIVLSIGDHGALQNVGKQTVVKRKMCNSERVIGAGVGAGIMYHLRFVKRDHNLQKRRKYNNINNKARSSGNN